MVDVGHVCELCGADATDRLLCKGATEQERRCYRLMIAGAKVLDHDGEEQLAYALCALLQIEGYDDIARDIAAGMKMDPEDRKRLGLAP